MSNLSLYRNLGSNLIDKGKWFLRAALPVKKTRYGAAQILQVIRDKTGLDPSKVYSADNWHDTTDIDTWKKIIEDDWTEKREWLAEHYDCDNHAGSFAANVAEIYLLNSAGLITVELRDPISGKHIDYHRACIFITDSLEVYLLESQTDDMVKMEKGSYPIIDRWEYVPLHCSIN